MELDSIENVKKHLSTLIKKKGYSHFTCELDKFLIRIYTNADYSDPPNIEYNNLTKYKEITVELYSIPEDKKIDITPVSLRTDYRFKKMFSEIQMVDYLSLFGYVTRLSVDGLCKLIIHINRINKLNLFQ